VKLSITSTVLQVGLIAKVTGFDVESDVPGHLGPPVVAQYKFKCLDMACMSSDAYVMMLFDDVTPKVSVFGDIDLASEYE
jgi:hypothetical protein